MQSRHKDAVMAVLAASGLIAMLGIGRFGIFATFVGAGLSAVAGCLAIFPLKKVS